MWTWEIKGNTDTREHTKKKGLGKKYIVTWEIKGNTETAEHNKKIKGLEKIINIKLRNKRKYRK